MTLEIRTHMTLTAAGELDVEQVVIGSHRPPDGRGGDFGAVHTPPPTGDRRPLLGRNWEQEAY